MAHSIRLWWFTGLLACFGLVPCFSDKVHGQTYKTRQIQGYAYVAVSDVAKQYNLGDNASSSDRHARYDNKGRSLSLAADRRDIQLQGTYHWLDRPVYLLHGQLWIAADDVRNTIDPVFRPRRAAAHSPVRRIVLDAGHGGKDRGAAGRSGHTERWLTLDLAKRVERILNKSGQQVMLTRTTDVTLSLEERIAFAKKNKADLFVSLHFNAGGSAYGIETYCLPPAGASSTANPQSVGGGPQRGNLYDAQNVWAAHCVQSALLARTRGNDRGVRRARFFVLRESPCPSILVEAGFLSNPQEEAKILTIAYRDVLAEAIAEGILKYVKSMQ